MILRSFIGPVVVRDEPAEDVSDLVNHERRAGPLASSNALRAQVHILNLAELPVLLQSALQPGLVVPRIAGAAAPGRPRGRPLRGEHARLHELPQPTRVHRGQRPRTHTLLECCRVYGKLRRILVVSTDEVYGDSAQGPEAAAFTEDSALRPNNPYAASKAAADLMAQTYGRCYRLPVVVARSNNVIGPQQHREKLVPAVVARIEAGRPALVEGDGLQLRSFLDIEDALAAFETIRTRGELGQVYNVAGACEASVLDVVRAVLRALRPGERLEDWTTFVEDRGYQDRRYLVSAAKLHALGWRPQVGLEETIGRILHARNLQTAPRVTGDSEDT